VDRDTLWPVLLAILLGGIAWLVTESLDASALVQAAVFIGVGAVVFAIRSSIG
jgi:hypothetical protein